MMEFCTFSFMSFNQDDTVDSIHEFLLYYDQEDLHCSLPTIFHKISSNTTKAAQYIQSNNIFHRDGKPANILVIVSNMYYNNLTDAQETANIFKSEPIICKLAHLGEARSKLLQTRVISNNSRTHFVRRGSPAYMAPEILVEESILKSAEIKQLKAIDVWALVMTFFVILNPDQKNLFQYDLEKRRASNAGLKVAVALLYFLKKGNTIF